MFGVGAREPEDVVAKKRGLVALEEVLTGLSDEAVIALAMSLKIADEVPRLSVEKRLALAGELARSHLGLPPFP